MKINELLCAQTRSQTIDIISDDGSDHDTNDFKYNTLLITYPILKRSRITPNTASKFQYKKIDLFI